MPLDLRVDGLRLRARQVYRTKLHTAMDNLECREKRVLDKNLLLL